MPVTSPSTVLAPQAPFGTQLKVLSVRLMRNAYRHPLLVALNFLATLAAAVGLALIFHNTGTDTGGIQNRCKRNLSVAAAGGIEAVGAAQLRIPLLHRRHMLFASSQLGIVRLDSGSAVVQESLHCHCGLSAHLFIVQAGEPVLHAAVPVHDQPELAAGLA